MNSMNELENDRSWEETSLSKHFFARVYVHLAEDFHEFSICAHLRVKGESEQHNLMLPGWSTYLFDPKVPEIQPIPRQDPNVDMNLLG